MKHTDSLLSQMSCLRDKAAALAHGRDYVKQETKIVLQLCSNSKDNVESNNICVVWQRGIKITVNFTHCENKGCVKQLHSLFCDNMTVTIFLTEISYNSRNRKQK